jgi:hypothetical protein
LNVTSATKTVVLQLGESWPSNKDPCKENTKVISKTQVKTSFKVAVRYSSFIVDKII